MPTASLSLRQTNVFAESSFPPASLAKVVLANIAISLHPYALVPAPTVLPLLVRVSSTFPWPRVQEPIFVFRARSFRG